MSKQFSVNFIVYYFYFLSLIYDVQLIWRTIKYLWLLHVISAAQQLTLMRHL